MNKYIVPAALISALLVILLYIGFFYINLNYVVSDDPERWGQLGDYFGGVLNPILSFFSIVLLISSLRLQNEANKGLVEQVKESKKTEKIRSFESQLFNMIESQKTAFDALSIRINKNWWSRSKRSVDAVLAIENRITFFRASLKTDQDITEALEEIDSHDQIYGVTRRFYIMIRMISEKLSDSEGFSVKDRKSHFGTVINFTDFALLRLILISTQFLDFPSTRYLRGNEEFNQVLIELGLGYDLY
ncbi:hypothetical protein [Pseudomonas aeruginosa]|uniref:hypothetical protein n=1 Tax=Pseudomonas aeruginosa TaxID=287 RepID=UPI000FC431C9|nr:hypothetical protein [Pseudomonas aeruginosa]RUB40147.1 hypothetical protein IPC1432_04710 [Pseudomonas aeruginosa]HCD6630743.1 hypothetical protein [Pseudomonas aeruginosa]HDQ4735004.1 hypothetical protein [Pseudomonas aeruginosa]